MTKEITIETGEGGTYNILGSYDDLYTPHQDFLHNLADRVVVTEGLNQMRK